MRKILYIRNLKQIHMSKRQELQNLMLQYTLVTRTYETADNKIEVHNILTDGWVSVLISKAQRDWLLKQAHQHERYQIGYEYFNQPTGDIKIDGYKPKEDLKLKIIHFHHIFIGADYTDQIFEDYSGDRRITFLQKSESLKSIYKQKQKELQNDTSQETTTQI